LSFSFRTSIFDDCMITIKKSISTFLLIIGFNIFFINSSLAKIHCQNQENQIKTIKTYRTGYELSDPIIELGSNEYITLTFDDLSDNPLSYSYTLIHCTSDWKDSKLIKSDFMDGFDINPINEYQNSYSTTVPYVHYNLQIPNNNVNIKLSGNYLIRVIDTYNPDKVIFEQRFMVVEPLLSINARLKQPINSESKLTSQQLELTVTTSPLSISNPQTDLITVALQNGQLQNSVYAVKPMFIRSNEIDYSSPDNLIFDGVNEFRSFDINSIRYISSGIQRIEQVGSEYSVLLQPDENNRNQKYSTSTDINGKYRVNLERSEQSDIEADYVWVYFTLPYYDQLRGKEVYIYGELTDWQLEPQNQMQYSSQREGYELRLKLKQGYYNYRYVVRDVKTGETDPTFFEGNHFETENSYLILVYFKQQGMRYERLVGLKRLNTRISN